MWPYRSAFGERTVGAGSLAHSAAVTTNQGLKLRELSQSHRSLAPTSLCTLKFARGMVGKFYLNSAEEEPGADRFFRLLEDPGRQNACLNVYAQDYLAYSFRIGGFWDGVKARWNRFAYWFNNLFKHSHGPSAPPSPPGTQIIHIPEILPRLVTLDGGIMSFVRGLVRDAERS